MHNHPVPIISHFYAKLYLEYKFSVCSANEQMYHTGGLLYFLIVLLNWFMLAFHYYNTYIMCCYCITIIIINIDFRYFHHLMLCFRLIINVLYHNRINLYKTISIKSRIGNYEPIVGIK